MMNTINLNDFVSELGYTGTFTICKDAKEYSVEYKGSTLTFYGPQTDDVIRVSTFSQFNKVYYSIVVGLMFEHDIRLIEYIRLGTERVNRVECWKVFDMFEESELDIIGIIDAKLKQSSSKWDSLVEMLKNDDEIDHWDIGDMVSPTLKGILEAELANRKMVKTAATNTLF